MPIYSKVRNLDDLGDGVLAAWGLDLCWQLADQGRTVIKIEWSIDDVGEYYAECLGIEDAEAPAVAIATVTHIRKTAT